MNSKRGRPMLNESKNRQYRIRLTEGRITVILNKRRYAYEGR